MGRVGNVCSSFLGQFAWVPSPLLRHSSRRQRGSNRAKTTVLLGVFLGQFDWVPSPLLRLPTPHPSQRQKGTIKFYKLLSDDEGIHLAAVWNLLDNRSCLYNNHRGQKQRRKSKVGRALRFPFQV